MVETYYSVIATEKESGKTLIAANIIEPKWWTSDANKAEMFDTPEEAKQWFEECKKDILNSNHPAYIPIESKIQIGKYTYEVIEEFDI